MKSGRSRIRFLLELVVSFVAIVAFGHGLHAGAASGGPSTVRDHRWIWAHEARVYDNSWGLKMLRDGQIEGMIFLASNICDLDLETVEWTRRWIVEAGDQPLRATN